MSVETDRELLELAAKAYGVRVKWEEVHGCYWVELGQGLPHEPWAPHDDDGDALRLAVKLRLVMHIWDDGETASVAKTLPDGNDPSPSDSEAWHSATAHAHNDDLFAATRRAIVRAAAQIGRAMP